MGRALASNRVAADHAAAAAHGEQPGLPAWLRYGVACLLVGLALGITMLIRQVLGEFVFALFYVAVMISAWYGGLGPGLLATVLSIVVREYLFVAPYFRLEFGLDTLLRLVVATAISTLAAARRSVERELRASNAALKAREQSARLSADRARALHAIAIDLSSALTMGQVADALLRHSGEVLGAAAAIVAATTAAGDELELLGAVGYPPELIERHRRRPLTARTPLADTARTGQMILIESRAAAVERYPALATLHDQIGLHAWANIPMHLPDGVVGAIEFSFAQPRGFDSDDQTFLLTLAQQCAQALDRARLYEAERRARETAERARERLRSLSEASRLLTDSLDYSSTLRQVADLAVPGVGDWCVVDVLGDDGVLEMAAAKHADPAKVALAYELRRKYPIAPDTPAGAPNVIRTGRPELYSDIDDSLLEAVARSPEELDILRSVGYRSIMIAPLRARGRVFGAITFVIAETRRRYDVADLAFAQELADRAAVALDNARLYQAASLARVAAEGAAERIARLQHVTAALSQAATPESVARVIVRAGLDAIGADAGAIFVLAEQGRVFQALDFRGYPAEQDAPRLRHPADRPSLLAEAVRTRAIVAVESPDDLVARWPMLAESQRGAEDAALATVPLVLNDEVLGVLYVAFRAPRAFTAEDRALLLSLAQQCAQALDRAQLYDRAQAAQRAAERAAERTARLQAVTAAFAAALTPPQVAEIIVSQGIGVLDAYAGRLALLTESGDALEIAGSIGYPAEVVASFDRYPLEMLSPLTDAVRERRLVLVESLDDWATRYPRSAPVRADSATVAIAAIPMLVEDRAIGGLALSFDEPHAFPAEERAYMLTLAQQSAQALERARLYAAEQRARAEAEAAVRLRDVFFSVAAHELKTPLTSLLGQAQLLQRRMERDRAGLDERYLRSAAVVAAQAERLHRMITSMLDIARIEQGQLSIERAPLELAGLALQVIEEVRPTLRRHALVFENSDGELKVFGDALRLEQVLQNLVGNAVKYSPHGGEVRVRVAREGDQALVEVVDQGIGIPETAMPHLFGRFFRAGNASEQHISGMGIGLYVVREIVGLHGGTVTARSQEGQGSTFAIRLPLADSDARSAKPKAQDTATDDRW